MSTDQFDLIQSELGKVDFVPVDFLSFKDEGFDLTEDAQDFVRDELLANRQQVIGEDNLGAFESLKRRLLSESEFQFDPAVSKAIDRSALARAQGRGVIGLADRTAADQRVRFAGISRGQLGNLLNFETLFAPSPINPIDTVNRLAQFEFQNRAQDANIDLAKIGVLNQAGVANLGFQTDALSALASNDPAAIAANNQANQQFVQAQSISNLADSITSGVSGIQQAANQRSILSSLDKLVSSQSDFAASQNVPTAPSLSIGDIFRNRG